MNAENEQMIALAEQEIEQKGIKFELLVEDIDTDLYEALLSYMLNHIHKLTDTEVEYIGDWHITIKAEDVRFYRG